MPRPAPMALENVEDALRALVGPVQGLRAVQGGDESLAFGFESGGTQLIARIALSAKGFEKDRFIEREFGSVLPIPAIHAIAPIADTYWLCVSECARGQTLQAAGAAEVAETAGAVAAILRCMATLTLPAATGFGAFDAHGVATMSSWQAFLLRVADPAQYDWSRYARRIDPALVTALLARLEALVLLCPERSGLVHGDFGSNNVLCAEGRVTGIIDWSEALIGDPLYDVANIVFWRDWLACMAIQTRYFQQHSPADLGVPERLDCYRLRIGLQRAFEAAQSGDKRVLDWILLQLRLLLG